MDTSEEKAKAPEKTKALCVATRCTSIDQFVATFHRFCDESSFFVATLATRPVGLETAFSIQLEDKTPVLRGLCVVVEAWSTPANRFGRPGVRLNVRRLTNESLVVFKQLQAARIAAEAAERAKADADDAKPADAKPPDAKPVDAKPIDAKPVDAKPVDAKPPEAKPVEAKPEAKPDAKFPELKPIDAKPKSLADKLAEIKATPKPPAIPPRKPDAIPSIPSAIPKIGPTAFAVKPPPTAEAPSIIIEMEIDEPTKIEAKTVRAEGTAPVMRTDPSVFESTTAVGPRTFDAKRIDAKAATIDTKTAPKVVDSNGIVTVVPPKPEAAIEAPPRSTPPRGANVTTPAIGISTSTLNLSNAALTAEDTQAQAQSYPDVPEHIAPTDDMTSPVASESRAPGSSFVLPANPLMNLSDKSLEGFVDCALYEETGNFFRAPGYEDSLVDIDDVAPPPGALSPMPAIRPGDEVSQAAYVIKPTTAPFAQQQHQHFHADMTPVPVMGQQYPQQQPYQQQYPQQQQPYPTGPMQYPMQSGTTNPPYGMQQQHPQPPMELAMSGAPSRRRWMIIGAAAVMISVLALVIVIATRGDDKTARAATTQTADTKTPETKVTMAVTPPSTPTGSADEEQIQTGEATTKAPEVPVAPTKPTKPATPDDEEHAQTGDPNSPPVVGSGPCKLTVTTTPAGSIVRLDDQMMGPSPITIQGACARKRIDVKHPRYAPGMRWVTLSESKPATVDIPLSRPTHAVTIVTQPAGATISIAGRRAGTSPTSVQLMGFTKLSVTIEKKGYKTVVESIYSKADGERRTVTLTRAK